VCSLSREREREESLFSFSLSIGLLSSRKRIGNALYTIVVYEGDLPQLMRCKNLIIQTPTHLYSL